MMSFLSFYVLRAMEKSLDEAGVKLSPERMIEELNEIRTFEVEADGVKYTLRTGITGVRAKILRALRAKIPSFVMKEERIESKQS